MNTQDWRIVLLGGNSGSGKTHVAKKIAEEKKASFLMVDDIRIALQQVTTQAQQPDLHVFLNYKSDDWKKPDKIFTDWLRVGKAMKKPLKAIIEHHVMVPDTGRIIIEGDGILPSLAQQSLSHKEVQAVFLVEDDKKKILENLRKRGRGFNKADKDTQKAFAHASWLYGQWLQKEAEAHNLPVLLAQPQETVIDRFLSIF